MQLDPEDAVLHIQRNSPFLHHILLLLLPTGYHYHTIHVSFAVAELRLDECITKSRLNIILQVLSSGIAVEINKF